MEHAGRVRSYYACMGEHMTFFCYVQTTATGVRAARQKGNKHTEYGGEKGVAAQLSTDEREGVVDAPHKACGLRDDVSAMPLP